VIKIFRLLFIFFIFVFIPFKEGVQKTDSAFPKGLKKKGVREWKVLEKLYTGALSRPLVPKTRIPKKIHQIWLGGELPKSYLSWQMSWQRHHPDWEYRLWTDADLADFIFSDKKRFLKATNKAEQADILRYEILYRYGGLYVDTDFECLKAFDLLHMHCDFYCGLEAKMPYHNRPAIGNALIGSVPGHPILKRCLEEISKHETQGDPLKIQKYTGPCCLTRAFLQLCETKGYFNVAFPFTYFYPLPSHLREEGGCKERWIQKESFAIHYWNMSWVPK
jgi:inositol phosphorylceramide mannosyltransferase catalytic subunit